MINLTFFSEIRVFSDIFFAKTQDYVTHESKRTC